MFDPKSYSFPDLHWHWTLAQPLTLSGVGLHSGLPVTMQILPREEPGLVFQYQAKTIPAQIKSVSHTQFCTCLKAQDVEIQTIEHTLAALWGLGITAAEICLDAPECPILDGSALPLVQGILEQGITPLPGPRPWLELTQPLDIQADHAEIKIQPASEFSIAYTLDYPGKIQEHLSWTWSPQAFITEIAPARSFAFEADLEALRQAGYIQGASLDSGLLLEKKGQPSSPWRLPLELVRHKILDLLGDFALLGSYPRAQVIALRAGHSAHVKMIKQLQASQARE